MIIMVLIINRNYNLNLIYIKLVPACWRDVENKIEILKEGN